jgi:hypothetical protein
VSVQVEMRIGDDADGGGYSHADGLLGEPDWMADGLGRPSEPYAWANLGEEELSLALDPVARFVAIARRSIVRILHNSC